MEHEAERPAWLAPTAAWVWLVEQSGRLVGANASSEAVGPTLAHMIEPVDHDALRSVLGQPGATCVARLAHGGPAVAWRSEPIGDELVVLLGKALTPSQVGIELDRHRRHLVQSLASALTHEAANSLGAIRSNVQYVQAHRRSLDPAIEPEVALALQDCLVGCDEVVDMHCAIRLLAEGVSMEDATVAELVRATFALARQPVRSTVRLCLGDTRPIPFRGDRQSTLHALIELVQWAARGAARGTDATLACGPGGVVTLTYVDAGGEPGPLSWVGRALRDRLGLRVSYEPGHMAVQLGQ